MYRMGEACPFSTYIIPDASDKSKVNYFHPALKSR